MLQVSFEVVSLFMRIPADLAVSVADERLKADSSLSKRTALSAEQALPVQPECDQPCIQRRVP